MTTTTSPTERVGRYQLLEPIGIGPSGTVSRAKVFGVAGFERQFAVKRFHTELTATAAMAAMLSAAARAYGSLEHPRIARMSEFGVAQGATFTAVEYVPGLDALRLIAEARLASGSGSGLATGGALALVSQAARAVGYAHGRGLTHLGLAPTNVIVTADGDIKITDFGILSATLPPRPIDVPRLAQRIPYLAPEQLANEATSAATDVFALGVLAYELVTGTRTFKGDTPQQVASAIMNGPPVEPPLPRPIVRVLQRCLARSPFERFPDARALADALDAALRVAPVPGTRKDIGAQVKETLDRLAALNEGQMSGMVALHLGTGPIRRLDSDPRPTAPASPAARDTATDRPSAPYELAPLDPANAAATLADLPRPMTTVPGLAPPPIAVPPGVAPPTAPATPGSGGSTLVGMGKSPPPALPGKPRLVTGSMPPVPPGARRPSTRSEIDLVGAEAPPPPEPAAASTESAVHTLEPSDLLSIDALPDEVDGGRGTTESGDDLGGATAATPAAEAPPSEVTGLPAGASVDDFSDAPTHALAGSAAAATLRPARAAEPQTTYRLDPSSIDTKPIPPVTLEPLLADPTEGSVRRPAGGAREARAAERRSVLDEDRWFEDSSAGRAAPTPAANEPAASSGSGRLPASPPAAASSGSGRVATPLPAAASGRVAAPLPTAATTSTRISSSPGGPGGSGRIPASPPGATPGSGRAGTSPGGELAAPEPKLGQTILGYAPAVSAPRATPPAPFPPAESLPPERNPEDELPVPSMPPERTPPAEPPGDQLSELMLEGFRTAPTSEPESLDGASGWQEQSAIAPSPAPSGWQEQSAIGPSPAPSAWQEPSAILPTPAPSGWQEPSAILPTPAPSGWQEPSAILPAPAPPGTPLSVHGEGPPRRRAIWIAVGMIGTAVVGVGAWQVYARVLSPPRPPSGGPVAIAPRPDRTSPSSPLPSSTATVPTDARAAQPAGALAGAGPAAGDAGAGSGSGQVAAAPPGPPPGPSDNLTISSTPPGARVFLDGADAGVTPVRLPGSPDRHNLALLLAGHDLHIVKVDGHGTFQIPLQEVTPTSGPAGIKVLKCKDKERYYVFLDGKPTGQTCPTERIECEMGPHTVEVYDLVSETRRKWDIVVKETRLSFRIRVE